MVEAAGTFRLASPNRDDDDISVSMGLAASVLHRYTVMMRG